MPLGCVPKMIKKKKKRKKGVVPFEVGPEARSQRFSLTLFWGGGWSPQWWLGWLAKWSLQALGPASLLCASASSTHSLPAPSRPAPPWPMGQQSPHRPTPQVYVLKRPHVDEFLQRMGELFECVLFTASLAKVSHLPLPLPPPGVPGAPLLLICLQCACDLWVPG